MTSNSVFSWDKSYGIKLQIWGTWLFYGVLVDLGDAVADEMSMPFERISLEMIYSGLYHFQVAHQKGLAADPLSYFAAPQNRDLGIIKPRRKPAREVDYCSLSNSHPHIGAIFFRAIVGNSLDHWLSALTCHP